jgi:hypothetical protein
MENNTLSTEVEDKAVLLDTVIKIIGIKRNNDLKIDGGDTTPTEPDKRIIWEIATDEVSEIYLVLPEHDPSKVFDAKLEKTSGKWEGKIKSKGNFEPGSSTEEKYTIIYKKKSTGTRLYISDPIIQVNT